LAVLSRGTKTERGASFLRRWPVPAVRGAGAFIPGRLWVLETTVRAQGLLGVLSRNNRLYLKGWSTDRIVVQGRRPVAKASDTVSLPLPARILKNPSLDLPGRALSPE